MNGSGQQRAAGAPEACRSRPRGSAGVEVPEVPPGICQAAAPRTCCRWRGRGTRASSGIPRGPTPASTIE
eukprot:3458029-Alexandrium_andersonii.AAC.1